MIRKIRKLDWRSITFWAAIVASNVAAAVTLYLDKFHHTPTSSPVFLAVAGAVLFWVSIFLYLTYRKDPSKLFFVRITKLPVD